MPPNTTDRPVSVSFNHLAGGIERMLTRFIKANKKGTVTVLQVQMFLHIARNPGITQRDLYEKAFPDSNDSVASRNIAILSHHGSRTADAMGLIEMRENPKDRRERTLHLTRKGELLVRDIENDILGNKRR